MVRSSVGNGVEVVTEPTDDMRSYHVSSQKIADELGFVPVHTIEDAVDSLIAAFDAGQVADPMANPRYYNIKTMQEINLA